MKKKVTVETSLRVRVNAYEVIQRAVGEGASRGWCRAHKHSDKPSSESVVDEITEAIMLALGDVLEFD